MSDTPKTDAIWDDFWKRYPDADRKVTVYFDMLLREREREIAALLAEAKYSDDADALRNLRERERDEARCGLADAKLTIEHLQTQRAALRDTLYKLRASIGATPSGEPQYLLRPAFEKWCRQIDAALGDTRPVDLERCTYELRKKGVAYPRTLRSVRTRAVPQSQQARLSGERK